jgi:hypothetical protein
MFGEWRIGPFKDQLAITFKRSAKNNASEGEEVRVPVTTPIPGPIDRRPRSRRAE